MQHYGLLLLRLVFAGTMLMAHGWAKLINFTERMDEFPDPFGISPRASLVLVIFAEVFCSFLIIIGLFTRLAAVPLIVCMAVAYFIIHHQDSFGEKELAMMYLAAFAALFFTGPGKYSIDKG